MDWVKLATNYYDDAALMRAGEAAEVLFLRALAYCGDQENDGTVPHEALARLTPTRGKARASALVREGLWKPVPQGWSIVSWSKHQESKDQLDAKRASARARQAKHRAQQANAVCHAVTNARVTPTEVEVEVEDAAAAASEPEPPTPLPPPVEILRLRLEAARLVVRWDKLTTDQLNRIVALIELHGDAQLVKAAVAAYRPAAPIGFAQGWLGIWQALPAPGRLALAVDPACTEPGHSGTTRHCTQCASERLAGGDR